jgi:hypothetical protein
MKRQYRERGPPKPGHAGGCRAGVYEYLAVLAGHR